MNLIDIKSPADIRHLSIPELTRLCDDLRHAFLTKVAAHGGHVGPNLGLVEATVALHYVFDTPTDKIVFDVSHQTYIHKMLTGRMQAFLDPAHYDDVTGYTEPRESEYDLFAIGHTSTAVSMAGGIAKGRDLQKLNYNVVALVGDGALSGGLAFEGLDEGATLGSNFIVVVNDNNMSIAENHGSLYDNLRKLRETDGNAPDNYFKALGYDYLYVPDGNNVEALIGAFSRVKGSTHPVVVHIHTDKGHGWKPAEEHKEEWHWSVPFNIATAQPLDKYNPDNYSEYFAQEMLAQMKADPRVCVLVAGTPGVAGFTPERRAQAGSQFIDVGIAEQEEVSMAAGLAKSGVRPCVAAGSSFIQRAFDQMEQDVAINNQPVVLTIFYGTMLGLNDVTHLGWWDIAMISNMPNWVMLAPATREEWLSMQRWAMKQTDHPVCIKLPGGPVRHSEGPVQTDWSDLNKFEITRRGSDVAIIGAGTFYPLAVETADALAAEGIHATVINPRYLSGLDTEMLDALKADHRLVLTLEDGVLDGGFGEKVARYYGPTEMRVRCYGIPKKFHDRYDYGELLRECHLTATQIVADVKSILS